MGPILFCAQPGCTESLACRSHAATAIQEQAIASGWSVNSDISAAYCPRHRGDYGLGANVPARPPVIDDPMKASIPLVGAGL